MWIVRLALRRPCTFMVMARFILALGGVSIFVIRKDILPTPAGIRSPRMAAPTQGQKK